MRWAGQSTSVDTGGALPGLGRVDGLIRSDPATGPGAHRVKDERTDDSLWAGYADAGDWSVYIQDSSEDVVRMALASVTSEDSDQ